MLSKKLEILAALKAKVALLEQELSGGLTEELAALPAQFGFSNAEEFISAVEAAAPGKMTVVVSSAKAPRGKVRRRAKITDKTRAAVKKMVASNQTGAAIAKVLGISLPSVQNIKKALGLVNRRK